jgi:hypothetical protein
MRGMDTKDIRVRRIMVGINYKAMCPFLGLSYPIKFE